MSVSDNLGENVGDKRNPLQSRRLTDGMSTLDDVDQWREELESKRDEKDEFFADHPQSPIPPEEREEFDGLDYFDPDPDYRVAATATVHDDPEVVLMDTTAGREMRYLRVATLEFALERADEELEDGTFELNAYQLESPNEEPLFVPFRDKTTASKATRAAGTWSCRPIATSRTVTNSSSTSTSRTLRFAPTATPSTVRCRPRRTGSRWRFRPASDSSNGDVHLAAV